MELVEAQARPVLEESLTAFEEAALVAVKAVPTDHKDDEAALVPSQMAAEQAPPIYEEPAPIYEEPAPVYEEAAPSPEEAGPILPEETQLLPAEAEPVHEEAAPAANDWPVILEMSTPVPEEDEDSHEEASTPYEEEVTFYDEAVPPPADATATYDEALPPSEEAPFQNEAEAAIQEEVASTAEAPGPAEAETLSEEAALSEEPGLSEALPLPGELAQSEEAPPDFPLSLGDLASLRDELLALRVSTDYVLACYARIAEVIPFQALGLFLAEGERLLLAASFGFPASSDDFLPLSLATAVGIEGGELEAEARALISPLLGISPAWPVRSVSLLAEAGVIGMWVYSEESLQTASPERLAALAALLAAPATRCTARANREIPKSAAGAELLASVGDAAYVSAFILELSFLPEAIGQHVPGIAVPTLMAAVEDGARRVLGPGGAVSVLPNSRLACLLASSVPLDAELALFQFRKSVKRSLALFEGVELPEGRAIALDLSAEGTAERLAAFLSE